MRCTLGGMTKKKAEGDRHRTPPFQVRLPEILRTQLEELSRRNLTTLSAEVVAALRKHLAENGLWPPPPRP